jgi:hypothetical protein
MGRVATIHYKRRSFSVPYSITRQAEGKTTKYVDYNFTWNCKICTLVRSIHNLKFLTVLKWSITKYYFKRLGYELDDRKSCFDSRHKQESNLFVTGPRPALSPTQSPIQWTLRSLSPEAKRPGHECDTHFHPVERLRMDRAKFLLPPPHTPLGSTNYHYTSTFNVFFLKANTLLF